MVPHHTNTITFVDLDGVVPHHHYKVDGVVFDQNFKFKMVLVFYTNTIQHGVGVFDLMVLVFYTKHHLDFSGFCGTGHLQVGFYGSKLHNEN